MPVFQILRRLTDARAFVSRRRAPGGRIIAAGAFTWAALGLAGCAGAPSALAPRSAAAGRIAGASWILFVAAGAVCLLVFGLMLFAVLRRQPASAAGNALAGGPELARRGRISPIAWIVGGGIVLPVVVLIGVFALGLSTLNAMPARADSGDLVIEITGHQWWWEVRYPDAGFETANEIHIPTNRTVELKLTTEDVIHSFWVPELAGKLDLIPGQTNTLVLSADQPGQYRGQCAEFCGVQHALMAMLVFAEPPDQFAAWSAAQAQDPPVPADAAARQGQQVLLGSACVYCHTIRGTNATGRVGPDLTHVASRRTIAAATALNTTGTLAGWVIDPQGIKPGNHMPPTDLSAAELQALLAYLETLK